MIQTFMAKPASGRTVLRAIALTCRLLAPALSTETVSTARYSAAAYPEIETFFVQARRLRIRARRMVTTGK
jgi:hypothetical protein